MKLQPGLAWTVGTSPSMPLPDRLVPLLDAIARTGSLAHAVIQCGDFVSRGVGSPAGVPIAPAGSARASRARQRGDASRRPASISWKRRRPAVAGSRASRRPSQSNSRVKRRDARRRPSARLRMAASHDLALAGLRDAIEGRAAGAGTPVRGKPRRARRLRARTRRRCGLSRADRRALRRRFRAVSALPVPAARPADPLRRARAGAHPAARQSCPGEEFQRRRANGLRFVNRQRGSGTRLLIDRHLDDEGIAGGRAGGLCDRGIHACGRCGDGGVRWRGRGIRLARRRRRVSGSRSCRWCASAISSPVRVGPIAKPPIVALIDALRGR